MKFEIGPAAIIFVTGAGMGIAAHHPHYQCPPENLCERRTIAHQPDGHEQESALLNTQQAMTTMVPSTATSTVPFGGLQPHMAVPPRGPHYTQMMATTWTGGV